jgi:CheY-like chemotaxis protein
VAQVDETRARVLLAEGRNEEAEKVARAAVRTLEKGDERSNLAEALTTHGTALARTGRRARARLTLQRAVIVAEQAGDLETAGQTALTIIEELSEHSTPAEMSAVYERAAELLSGSRHPGVTARMVACARRVIGMLAAQAGPALTAGPEAPSEWEGFSFRKEMRRYERRLIERALKDARGVITKAAALLGFKHHYSLIALINRHHRDLLRARSPVVPRRRSIIRDAATRPDDKGAQPVTILNVEDNRLVADLLKEALEAEGWKVESRADGYAAMTSLVGEEHYDLLLLDYDLPGVNGVELLRLVRKLPHRRRTPAIIISASDCEAEAWRAGANAFLRKPEDVSSVAETVARLLKF